MTKILADQIKSALSGVDADSRTEVVVRGAEAGLWPLWPALEALHELYAPQPARTVGDVASAALEKAARAARRRRPPLTRRRRWDERPQTPTGRFVRAVSLDPVLDWTLGDGPLRTLQLVLSLAGGVGKPLVTLTCSIARQIGRTTRTIQNHWNALTEAGWIIRSTDRRTGLVTVTVTEAARPPEVRSENPAPWPRQPEPQQINKPGWWKRRRQSRELRRESAADEGGAKSSSPIKESLNSTFLSVRAPGPVLPIRNAVAAGEGDLLLKRRLDIERRAQAEMQERFGRPTYGMR